MGQNSIEVETVARDPYSLRVKSATKYKNQKLMVKVIESLKFKSSLEPFILVLLQACAYNIYNLLQMKHDFHQRI